MHLTLMQLGHQIKLELEKTQHMSDASGRAMKVAVAIYNADLDKAEELRLQNPRLFKVLGGRNA